MAPVDTSRRRGRTALGSVTKSAQHIMAPRARTGLRRSYQAEPSPSSAGIMPSSLALALPAAMYAHIGGVRAAFVKKALLNSTQGKTTQGEI